MRMRTLVAIAFLGALSLLAGCTEGPRGGQHVAIVAGAGQGGTIAGWVEALAAHHGRVVLIGISQQDVATMWTIHAKDSAITTQPLPKLDFPTDLGITPDGTAYILDHAGIWRVRHGKARLVIKDPDPGGIESLAVDDHGALLWTSVAADSRPGSDHTVLVVHRLKEGQTTTVAGTTRSADRSGRELFQRQEHPPPHARAVGFTLLAPGPGLGLAAGASGIYLLGDDYVLRVSPGGSLTHVLGGAERHLPDGPFQSEMSASNHGFEQVGQGVSTDGSRFAVLDSSPAPCEAHDENGAFTWTGDFTKRQQKFIEQVMATPFSYWCDTKDPLGQMVVVVDHGRATTAAAHARVMALDGDSLYVVGQIGRASDPGGAEAILVRIKLNQSR